MSGPRRQPATLRHALVPMLAALAAASAMAYDKVGSGYNQPLFLTAPTGDPRLFIVEKGGVIKTQLGGTVSTYLDLSAQVDTAGERGLLGLAFDPNYASNGRFYVDYIDKVSKNTVVAAYTAPVPGSGPADAASAKPIITVIQDSPSNHKAGWIGFSKADPGRLYIATGDGGSSNDPNNNAQNLGSNLGKMLRITPLQGGGYIVPSDNPFVNKPGNDEIWAFGLRNPYRNSFDRLSGDLWIADVGQGVREEIDFAVAGTGAGANYGWRVREGKIPTPGISDPAPAITPTDPIHDYDHSAGNRAVVGGYVYRGGVDATLDGLYVFGDYGSGRLWTLQRTSGAPVISALTSPFGANTLGSFGEDGFGGLYAVGLNGDIYLLATGAVPEPGAWMLLAPGLALLGWHRRRAPICA